MNTKTPSIRLRQGPDALIRQGHPWIFKGAIAGQEGTPRQGGVVDVLAANGEWIARGLANPDAPLAVRVFTRNRDETLDEALLLARLDAAVALRERLFGVPSGDAPTNAYRLVYSEADLLPGLVVDRYNTVLSIQVRSGVWAPYLPAVLDRLKARTGLQLAHVAISQDHERREALDAPALTALGDRLPDVVPVREHGFDYEVGVGAGQKTGFYLDQRENRHRTAAYAAGRDVLSAYCYTGAFELHAARGGAGSILGIDASQPALDQARRHHTLNSTAVAVRYERGDVPQVLRRFRDARTTFDMIILDPPRFVVNRAQKDKGLRAYKDINLMAMKLLRPDGILATFSCSGLVEAADFRHAIAWAAQDAGRSVGILETLSQPPDHPILTAFPESEYLKGLICWVR